MEYSLNHYATITYALNGIDVEDKVLLDPALDPVTQVRDRVETIRLTNEATAYTIGERYDYEPVYVDQTITVVEESV
jgi:hypothetical protein